MRIRITLVLLPLSCIHIIAQQPLSIGEPVPDIHFATVLNHTSPKASLADFKGRLIILDFWATWCGSCIHALPKMDALQKQFSKDLKVLLVSNKNTGDDLAKVQAFQKKWQQRTGSRLNLATVINDTITQNLFPHQLLPHYVWIGKNRKVLAITSSEVVTAANIKSALSDEPLSFIMKKDQETERPVFLDRDISLDQLQSYSILVKGWYDGLPSGNRIRQREGMVCGRAMLNTSLLDMYRAVARGIDTTLTAKQFLVVTNDSSELFAPPAAGKRKDWYRQHAYSLDVMVLPGEAPRLFERMLAELNRNGLYEGRFETQQQVGNRASLFVLRKTANCFVLPVN
ncbi:MAG TPA: TlpA disulfide reductase family protein [Flavisolibacter sp.]|jgi:thiol-disulfide isomerase/thioredoxin|nr:TlpA disulfide reductase family protein [Flavisolibacter sp.]